MPTEFHRVILMQLARHFTMGTASQPGQLWSWLTESVVLSVLKVAAGQREAPSGVLFAVTACSFDCRPTTTDRMGYIRDIVCVITMVEHDEGHSLAGISRDSADPIPWKAQIRAR